MDLKLIYSEGEVLYFIQLNEACFIQNYYFGFVDVYFSHFMVLDINSWNIKKIGKRLFPFCDCISLSVITSLVMLYPTFLDLRTHGEKFFKG